MAYKDDDERPHSRRPRFANPVTMVVMIFLFIVLLVVLLMAFNLVGSLTQTTTIK